MRVVVVVVVVIGETSRSVAHGRAQTVEVPLPPAGHRFSVQ